MRKVVNYPQLFYNPNSYVAFVYARDIKERFPEAEPMIMTSSFYSFLYARDIIKGRWPEAEPYIKRINFWWNKYCRDLNIS